MLLRLLMILVINFLQGHCFLIINYLLCSVCSVDTLLTVLLNVNKNNYVTAVRMRRGAAFCISLVRDRSEVTQPTYSHRWSI